MQLFRKHNKNDWPNNKVSESFENPIQSFNEGLPNKPQKSRHARPPSGLSHPSLHSLLLFLLPPLLLHWSELRPCVPLVCCGHTVEQNNRCLLQRGLRGVRRSWKDPERCTAFWVDRSMIVCVYVPHSEHEKVLCEGEMELLTLLNEARQWEPTTSSTGGGLPDWNSDHQETRTGAEGVNEYV